MVNPPNYYAEWVEVLEKLKSREDDEACLNAMQRGRLEWQGGVAERFATKLSEALSTRLNRAIDRFQRDRSHAQGQERVIVQALTALRRELQFLVKAVKIPALPEEYQKMYYDMILRNAKSIQSALESSARSDRSGKMAVIVRNNRVDAI